MSVEKTRLDQRMAELGMVASRSQAESYIRLGKVKVNGKLAQKTGQAVSKLDKIDLAVGEQYVSRAALKLQSAAAVFKLDFQNKTVLDVGSSTGGFTQYALLHGAAKVVAVDVGTNQLHQSLRSEPKIELHEKTDIRDYSTDVPFDIVVGDVSFVSLREILPHVATLMQKDTLLVAMVKPQFEAAQSGLKHKGVIKNDRIRRDILKSFEEWAKERFVVLEKADSAVAGSKGNVERFYLLRKVAK